MGQSVNDFLGALLKTPKPATSSITAKTRRESHRKTDKATLSNRVLEVLQGKQLTAREIAEEMYYRDWIIYPARAVIQPRITELVESGEIEAVGSKLDEATQRKVAVYKVV